MRIEPFRVEIGQPVLNDLHRRLENTRWAEDFANDDWRYGANIAAIRDLVGFWREEYDWRATEAAINLWPQYRTDIDGVPVHFLHIPGKGPNPKPLLLNHGWPWTFWDFRKVIGPLSDPAAYGGDAEDAFELVVPSLPGFGFSSPLRVPGIDFVRTADMWVRLMEALGHRRFATQGADWGSFISAELGHRFADRLIGVHTQLLVPLGFFCGAEPSPDLSELTEAERALLPRTLEFRTSGMGYAQLQSTKPQTPAVALADSPAGLLAWLVEKRRSWSDSEGDLYRRFSRTDLIDSAMLYWVTDTFGTSARYYYEARINPWRPAHDRWPRVEAPTAVANFPKEIVHQPRAWAERYFNIQRWTDMPAGGHFGAMEEPALLVADIRAFFRERD